MIEPDVPSPRSNVLYAAIVATVAARGPRAVTVRDIAERFGTSPRTAACCIAIHRHMRTCEADRLLRGTLELPAQELDIPGDDDIVDETLLGLPARENLNNPFD